MSGMRLAKAAVAAIVLTACTVPDDLFGDPRDGFVRHTDEIIDDTDWSTAETVTVTLSEFGFSPETLRFRIERPYILKLTNSGSVSHRFVSHDFFRSIAARRLLYSDAEASFPKLEAIALAPHETKSLYFIPVTTGAYRLTCDQPFHRLLGMTGRIVVR